MSYPYGGQGGGYPPAGAGYPPQPLGMPTPESASAAAYGSAPGGGLPYASQPGAPGGYGGFGGAPPQGYGAPPQGYGAPPGQPGYPMPSQAGYPASGFPGQGQPQAGGYPGQGPPGGFPGQAPQAGYPGQAPQPAFPGQVPSQPGYPGQVPAQPGYPGQAAPPAGGGYQGQAQPGYPGSAPGYGGGSAPGYGSAPAPQAGYGAPAQAPAQAPAGYGGAPPPTEGGGYKPPTSDPSAGAYGAPGASTYKVVEEGTLRPAPNFNPETDSQKLRKSMKGFGTDEKAIIDILAYRTCDQRQQIKLMYKTCFGRDLLQDLKSELSGHFEDTCIALLYKTEEYDAYELRRAMRGAGTDESALIEILCTRNNNQIRSMVAAYKAMYGRKLEDDIISETSGHFKKLLVSMTTGGRMENQSVDQAKAQQDAKELYEAGQKRWGTDENTFNRIMASQSYEQLRAVFDAYSRIVNCDIEKALMGEFSGNMETSMLTIVRVVRNKSAYFCDRLYHSMKGAGTDDKTLVRVVVTRCEVDMKQIKDEFQRRYGKTLESFIRDDISGDYKRVMMAMVGGVP